MRAQEIMFVSMRCSLTHSRPADSGRRGRATKRRHFALPSIYRRRSTWATF